MKKTPFRDYDQKFNNEFVNYISNIEGVIEIGYGMTETFKYYIHLENNIDIKSFVEKIEYDLSKITIYIITNIPAVQILKH